MRINGKKIPTYFLDNKESLLNRISAKLETLPEYIIDPIANDPIATTDFTASRDVIDFLAEIKKAGKEDKSFSIFVKKWSPGLPPRLEEKEMLKLWLAFNTQLEDLEKYESSIIDTQGEQYVKDGYFSTSSEFKQFWQKDRNLIKKNIAKKIQENIQNSKKLEAIYTIFEQIEEGLVFTDFKSENTTLSLEMDIKNITLAELFNHILLTQNVPFATYEKYYKILKNFVPPEEWAVSQIKEKYVKKFDIQEENIMMKIYEKKDKYKGQSHWGRIHENMKNDYATCITTKNDSKIITRLNITTQQGYISKEEYLSSFFNSFTGLDKSVLKFTNIGEEDIVGKFYFPMSTFNSYVFTDMVMMDEIFSSLINIDESTKTTKRAGEIPGAWTHIHFNHPKTGHITASIAQKTVDVSSPEMKRENREIFPHNTPYIRVRTRGKNMQSILNFQNILSKLLVIYLRNYDDVVKEYQPFIKDFGENVIEDIPLKRKEQELKAPDVFVRNYTRFCTEERMPTILRESELDKKEIKKMKKDGNVLMKYPRDSNVENTEQYASDGVNQNYYMCSNPAYPYPGVKINTSLENSEEYPFVPCCFADPQDKTGGNYGKYFYNEVEVASSCKKQQDLIKTDKILGNCKHGTLPETLHKFFEFLDGNTDFTFIRLGMLRTYSSFLHAVMVGLYLQTNILAIDEVGKIQEKLLEVRKELSVPEIAVMSKQCNYDVELKNICESIASGNTYLDPKLYIQMLEGYFNCNIFLFNKDGILLPRFSQGYYQPKRSEQCIFIYENWGSESDNAKYPQCELIVKWNTKKGDDIQYSFDYTTKISKNIIKTFNLVKESYVLNKLVPDTIFPILDHYKVISQNVDGYGKTRCVNIEVSGKQVSLLTTPLAPLSVKISNEIVKCDITTATSLFDMFSQNVVGASADANKTKAQGNKARGNKARGKVIEIAGRSGNVDIYIPIEKHDVLEHSSSLEGAPIISEGAHSVTRKPSALDLFNLNKKLARYIVEYILWLFSRYISEIKMSEIKMSDATPKTLSNFAKKYIKIDPEFKYENVSKIFSMQSKFMDNGKLVVTSEDMLKRVMYILKMYSIRDMRSLINYKNREVISNYYLNITDFDEYDSQVILQGEDAIDKWIRESNFAYILYNTIKIGQKTPYFFENSLISEDVYLAQNEPTLQKALSVAMIWKNKGFNPSFQVEPLEDVNIPFTLYSYISPNDITKYEIGGDGNNGVKPKIIGYKLSGITYYTVLLELD